MRKTKKWIDIFIYILFLVLFWTSDYFPSQIFAGNNFEIATHSAMQASKPAEIFPTFTVPTIAVFPTFSPIKPEKEKGGLSLRAPKVISFPKVKTSTNEQWSDVGFDSYGDKSTIVIEDSRETGVRWTLTGSFSDFTDGDSLLPIGGNLYLSVINKSGGKNTDVNLAENLFIKRTSYPYILASTQDGYGKNRIELGISFRLRIPPNTPIGDYSANFVITIL